MTIRHTRLTLAALAGLALLGACGSGDAPAAPAAETATVLDNGMTVSEVVDARQTHLKAVGKAFKTISDNLKASEPDMAAIQAAAASVPTETADMGDWFPEGSGPASGVKTDALPAIWENKADFDSKIADFHAASATLASTAEAGDIAAISEAFKATGATCKSCHETYRADD
ncbi:c-type cytochrome [Hyphomonas chukchiensis]|uniref:Cytochrome C n=1 Tax=Hyphomonas chukchiensis TaxID=1280947 RepID=A0A062USB4_9PROT|nr:cytochrome c [Hyphomonas chukchiensis]KCZ60619.1 hypothetical protein HY30_11645 [Hyphomonas chukchiensis]